MYNVYDIVHPNVVKYAQKCRNTHTCDINVSFIQCQILRVMSTQQKCQCNLQSNMRGSICHAISLHPQSMPSIPRQKYVKISKMKTHISMYT